MIRGSATLAPVEPHLLLSWLNADAVIDKNFRQLLKSRITHKG